MECFLIIETVDSLSENLYHELERRVFMSNLPDKSMRYQADVQNMLSTYLVLSERHQERKTAYIEDPDKFIADTKEKLDGQAIEDYLAEGENNLAMLRVLLREVISLRKELAEQTPP